MISEQVINSNLTSWMKHYLVVSAVMWKYIQYRYCIPFCITEIKYFSIITYFISAELGENSMYKTSSDYETL